MKLKILAISVLLLSGLAESIINPGPTDALNALAASIVIYVMFRVQE